MGFDLFQSLSLKRNRAFAKFQLLRNDETLLLMITTGDPPRPCQPHKTSHRRKASLCGPRKAHLELAKEADAKVVCGVGRE
jgi:hypothetical protein